MEHSHLLDHEKAVQFIFGGKAVFTIKSKQTGTRFTFKVIQAKKNQGDKTVFFCKLLNGPQNTQDYKFFGSIVRHNITGKFEFFFSQKASRITNEAPSVKAFDHVINNLLAKNINNVNLEIWHEGRCARCSRLLTTPESIQNGIGPECIKFFHR